jgi:HSP20 family molecular chaperone IbpA
MMHKVIKRLFFIATLVTIFSDDCTARTKNEKIQAKPTAESTYTAQDPFKDDFDDFFKDIDSWFYGPSIKPKSTEETSMRSLMKDIQTWSAKLHKNATNSLYRLRNKSFSDVTQELKDIQAKLEASNKNLQELIGRTEKENENSKKAGTFAVQEKASDASYTVTVDVPGINKDDVVVTVHAGDQTHKEANTLEISTKEKKEKADKAPKEPGVKSYFERHMQSSVIDNGHIKTKDYHFSYDNGAVRITQKLPDDIDPDKYTMTFNDEKIVIVFEKKAGAKKVKALEFSEKASKKGKTCAEK